MARLAGVLDADVSTAALAALGVVSVPLLVVVDEAPARVDEVAGLLIRLVEASSDIPLHVRTQQQRQLQAGLASHPVAQLLR